MVPVNLTWFQRSERVDSLEVYFCTSPFDMVPKGIELSNSLFDSFGTSPFDMVPKVKSLMIGAV